MKVQMLAQAFFLTPSLHDHLQRCLRHAFAQARSRIARVVVRLDDLNGRDGRRDKVCQVNVSVPGRPEVVIREMQEDMYHAIERALQRAAYRAMRLLACAQPVPRTPPVALAENAAEPARHG